jgi:hypothetical protein
LTVSAVSQALKIIYTVRQNNRNTTDIVHTSLVMWYWTTFPAMQPQTFLELTRTSFEQSLAELYIILLEEHLQIASEMLEVVNCPSL